MISFFNMNISLDETVYCSLKILLADVSMSDIRSFNLCKQLVVLKNLCKLMK